MPWNSGVFDAMPKKVMTICIYLLGFTEQGFWQSFDHKSVPAVLGIYSGFGKRKVIIPAIPQP